MNRSTSGLGKGKVFTETANVHILNINQANEAEKAGAIKRNTYVRALN